MLCPKCALENPDSARFCLRCHYMLLHRCPMCWYEQRTGGTCGKCGANFALCWELALERSVEDAQRLWWDRLRAAVGVYFQFMLLPFTSLLGLLRSLVIRLFLMRLSNR
jgi:hypothetical protein